MILQTVIGGDSNHDCPPPMMDALDKIFTKLHIDEDRIIKESF